MMSKPSDHHLSRRAILAASALGAGLAGSKALAQQSDAVDEMTKDEGSADTISPKIVACAEKLVPIRYTVEERAQIVSGIEAQVQSVALLREQTFDNALAPALVFNPRLPGRQFPDQKNKIQTSPPVLRRSRPTKAEDFAFASLVELGSWLRGGVITSVRLTEIYLDRIKRYGDTLECFITITPKLALKQAQEADAAFAAGKDFGPLHGIPYGVKDLFDTANISTTWGAAPYKDRIPDSDAHIVTKLRDAGAVLLGKTTCGALAYGDIWFDGKTRNPWNIKEGSSGSSAGSASATAAGLVGFSIGTETLGSIVSPSNRCGATGLRPTFGRVSRNGAMALCWSLDKVGTICRNVEDTVLVLATINGGDVQDAGSIDMGFAYTPERGQKALVVGYDPAWFSGDAAHDIDRNALKALKKMGVKTKTVSLPELPYGVLYLSLLAESAAAFEELTLSGRDDLLVWQDDDAWPNTFRQIRFLSSVDYIQLDRLRRKTMLAMDALMNEVDVLITPNFAANLLTITNYTGHPCLTLRAGFLDSPPRGVKDKTDKTTSRVPRNISLIGKLFDEGTLCALGNRLEAALGVYGERPPMA
jgi:Asp-tRNA(Asn)/Glu-tRNA(Gln) amidotransferase A subunit family amidase